MSRKGQRDYITSLMGEECDRPGHVLPRSASPIEKCIIEGKTVYGAACRKATQSPGPIQEQQKQQSSIQQPQPTAPAAHSAQASSQSSDEDKTAGGWAFKEELLAGSPDAAISLHESGIKYL
jgi:hypothetical protein